MLMLCFSAAVCLTCIVNGTPVQYNPEIHLCCEGIYARVQNGHEMRCCIDKKGNKCLKQTGSKTKSVLKDYADDITNGSNKGHRKSMTYIEKTQMCDAELIAEIRNIIETDKRRNSNVTEQSVAGSTKCPLCITGNYKGHIDCKKRIQLNIILKKIQSIKHGILLLDVEVTYPRLRAGKRFQIKTRVDCRKCFREGAAYVIFTNRWVNSLPRKSRLTERDIIVRKDQLSSFSCKIYRWAKQYGFPSCE
ncbi:hypothetical protein DPMN_102303 [Dreissena polymorpha]|uniref:NTR domain-containing protein n=1 Tax=Dreissena polymorpha TaxID=45954 RepID=A0A9D4R8Z7_DREPO|nr:hypothetical protein DPMN_102303 [Dreissena polymorpha]